MVRGRFNDFNFYEIDNYDEMQPFFISLASDTDLWMYLSSTGGLTCGRRSPNEALFPYYTDDKITENYETTGPRTVIKVKTGNAKKEHIWKPFSSQQQEQYDIERRISKSGVGDRIVFREKNNTLHMCFSYFWVAAGKHGWIRHAMLENLGNKPMDIDLTDSLLNVLPAGVERKTQNEFSTLVDAYKKTELVEGTSLVLFRMEALLVDRAEPSEALRCNTVYSLGLPEDTDYSASNSKGVRGAYVAHAHLHIEPQQWHRWYNICDVSQDAVQVRDLIHFLKQPDAIEQIQDAIEQSADHLKQIVAHNDGVQKTSDPAYDTRHFANVLFNTMRGGYYLNDYSIGREAFRRHLQLFNQAVAERHEAFLAALPAQINRDELITQVRQQNDPQLLRLTYEYLPLTFGRRHGDPSRPWNLFNVRVQDEQGNPIVSYQGNWRDIFQNWEALSLSYPGFINSIIAKFLNATTADGYNPYKVTSEGIEWEVIEPENPWSNIGYWGDHQIIYLLKLLELSYKHDPDTLRALLNEKLFSFANVPYRIKSYAEIVADPKNSIRFDDDLHKHIMTLAPQYGADAKLILDGQNEVWLTTMADKLLIPLLTKLSNFIPDAGIWMNTLRPEWNDANNALVGYGTSMVTLYYMRRYVAFLLKLMQEDVTIADETLTLLRAIRVAYTNANIKQFTDIVGTAGERYRNSVYAGLSGNTQTMEAEELQEFLTATLHKIDDSIRTNKREDGLYEAYNLIKFKDNTIEISHLYEMLEGQVAILSSGFLSAKEAVELLNALVDSALYREDQNSYMLYPNRPRKTFLELNNLPEETKNLPVVQKYLGTILKQDCEGGIHFDASFTNANNLPDELKDLYEQVFNHHAFTGRSGTFYKYEGLGCIYWHMVSKLLLAVGEFIANFNIKAEGENWTDTYFALLSHYGMIRNGIGSHKTPDKYGAFPFDPYSHTPSMAGVQQPGMTGQVKEDIISRFFELGVYVNDGQISFTARLIHVKDFDEKGEIHLTYCGVPICYLSTQEQRITVRYADGTEEEMEGLKMTREQSRHIFARDGHIASVTVCMKQ